jgi:hypothetical protein
MMQGRLTYYVDYANMLASWGIAVLQYDLKCWMSAGEMPCAQLQNISAEVRRCALVLGVLLEHVAVVQQPSVAPRMPVRWQGCSSFLYFCTPSCLGAMFEQCEEIVQEAALPDILAWARRSLSTSNSSNTSEVKLRWDMVAVAGHSRGGDVAYHQLQLFDWVKCAVLIDPVKQPNRVVTSTAKPHLVLGATSWGCGASRLCASLGFWGSLGFVVVVQCVWSLVSTVRHAEHGRPGASAMIIRTQAVCSGQGQPTLLP